MRHPRRKRPTDWTDDEDAALVAAVQKHGLDWAKVSKDVESRNYRQCYDRHRKYYKRFGYPLTGSAPVLFDGSIDRDFDEVLDDLLSEKDVQEAQESTLTPPPRLSFSTDTTTSQAHGDVCFKEVASVPPCSVQRHLVLTFETLSSKLSSTPLSGDHFGKINALLRSPPPGAAVQPVPPVSPVPPVPPYRCGSTCGLACSGESLLELNHSVVTVV